jgi:hypothetical protein
MNDVPQEYSPELKQLAWFDIPAFPKKEATFLDVADVAHHENTISHIYAWFINHANKNISALFVDTLLTLIREKGIPDFEFDGDCFCEREYQTPKGNRIDLVLTTDSTHATHSNNALKDTSAIIIKNKIFHFLANDLQDYLDAVPATHKAGVLLTLRKEIIPEEVKNCFVNITHAEWCRTIQQKGIPHNLSPKEYIYLTDFLSHMAGIENSPQAEEARFFFDHSEKILKAVQVHDRAWDYLIAQLKHAANRLDCELSGSAYAYRHIWDSKNDRDVYYSIVIRNTLTAAPEIMILIEVYRNGLKNKVEIDNAMTKQHYFNLEKGKDEGETWKHIAGKTYLINSEQWNDLGNFIYNAVNKDFSKAMQAVIEAIK